MHVINTLATGRKLILLRWAKTIIVLVSLYTNVKLAKIPHKLKLWKFLFIHLLVCIFNLPLTIPKSVAAEFYLSFFYRIVGLQFSEVQYVLSKVLEQ